MRMIKMMKKQTEQGYTLIYVVIILFMLSFLVLYGVNKLYVQRQNLAVSVAVQTLKNMQEAAQDVYMDYGAWPYLNIYQDGTAVNFNENALYHYYYPVGNIWRKNETGGGGFTPRPFYPYPDMGALSGQQWPIPSNNGGYTVPYIDPGLLLSPFQRSSINPFIQESLTDYWNHYPNLYPYPAYLKSPYYEFEIMTQPDARLNLPPTPAPTSSPYFSIALKGLDNPQIANQILTYLPGSYDSTGQALYTVVPQPVGISAAIKYKAQVGRVMSMGKADIYYYAGKHAQHPTIYPWTQQIPMPVCTNGVANSNGQYNNYYPYIFFGATSFQTTYPQMSNYDKNAEMKEMVYFKQTCQFLSPTNPDSRPGYWYIGMRTIGRDGKDYPTKSIGTLSYFTTCLPMKPTDQVNSLRYVTGSSSSPTMSPPAVSDIYAITSDSYDQGSYARSPDSYTDITVYWPKDSDCQSQYPDNLKLEDSGDWSGYYGMQP